MDMIRDIFGFLLPGIAITLWTIERLDQSGRLKGTLSGEIIGETKAVLRKYIDPKKKNDYEIKV